MDISAKITEATYVVNQYTGLTFLSCRVDTWIHIVARDNTLESDFYLPAFP